MNESLNTNNLCWGCRVVELCGCHPCYSYAKVAIACLKMASVGALVLQSWGAVIHLLFPKCWLQDYMNLVAIQSNQEQTNQHRPSPCPDQSPKWLIKTSLFRCVVWSELKTNKQNNISCPMVTACNKLQLINISTASTPLYAVCIVTLSGQAVQAWITVQWLHMNCITFRRSLLRRGSWGSVLSSLSLWGCAKSMAQVSSNACLCCCHSGAAHIVGSSTNHSKKKHEGLKCVSTTTLSYSR